MRPVQDIWAHFAKFNSSQLAAVAPEHESPNAGWYNRFARHPYFGKLGECHTICIETTLDNVCKAF